ncbi:MAG: hypothetical protein ACREDU_05335, partial [Methylocella sp.]
HEARLSNFWKDAGLPPNILTDYLASDPSDPAAEGRLKSAAESVLTGLALEGLTLGARAIRAAKTVKRTKDAEQTALHERYGDLTEEDFSRLVGDPSQPVIETRIRPQPAAPGKIGKAIEDLRAPRGPKEHSAYGIIVLGDESAGARTIDKLIVNDAGERIGRISGAETAKTVRIDNVSIDETAELGKGYAVKAYSDVVDYALANGKTMVSDTEITKDAARVYEALGRRGYVVERNQHAALSTVDGVERWRAPGPVYKITDKLRVGTDDIIAGRGVVDAGEMQLYINFNRIGGPDDVKATIAEVAERLKGSIDEARRGVITHAETEKMADDLGMTVSDLLARRRGQPLNAEQAVAARKLWQASGEALLLAAKNASAPNAGALDQYAFRKAMAVHHAIQSEVIGARTETARALASWRITAQGGIERARAVDQMIEAMGGPEASREMARRLAILAEHGDPRAMAKFVEKGYAAASFDAVR